ncbi:MAG: orotidine-5'-phosphate decarboxylase [Deltaproteobacteria bacterium]
MNRKIILALDVASLSRAGYFLNKLYPRIKLFKIGSVLFTACGPRAIELIRKKGGRVFLDLKFFDIPNTVAQAVAQAVRHKVSMLTLHINGGEEMIRAAVKAAKDESRRLKIKKPLLIGVTVLTSKKAYPREILALARSGLSWGLDGVVCSARESAFLRKKIKGNFVIVTPGIRADRAKGNDQKRTATASEALAAGSSFLVIGRPILEAEDPLRALKELI